MTAGTSFSEIYDQFMMLVEDYRLVSLYESSSADFEAYLEGWLLPATEEFSICDQILDYSLTTSSFDEILTRKNITILAQLMKKYWLEKEIDDVTQMNLRIQDHDFKNFSEAQNMQQKRERFILEKESISQLLADYSIKTMDWAAWVVGDFGI
jgi:hypothetical protein